MAKIAKNPILKSQANEIYEAIRQIGLDPSEFQWIERDSTMTPNLRVSVLIHRPTEYYFIFDYHRGKHWTERSPGPDSAVDTQYPGSWEGQRKYALGWLRCLKVEVGAPDLWGAISQETRLAEAASASDITNTPFTLEEQGYISARLHETERYLITTQSLSEENAEFVRKRLNYLEEAAGRQGRQDWLHTTIGVLVTIVVGVALAPSAAHELFRFVANVLGQVLSGILSSP